MKFMKRQYVLPFLILVIALSAGLAALRLTGSGEEKDRQYREAFTTSNQALSVPLPDELTFAGEAVPLNQYFVRESLDRELLVNTYWHSNTILMLKRAARFFPMMEGVLRENGVPDDFKYLALIESGLMNVVSPSNAAGFWQFLDKTARQFGLEVTDQVDERYHVQKATEAACRYLKSAYSQYGNWTLAAASYNAGMGRITREKERQSAGDFYNLYLNQETSRYIYRILALKLIYENPTAYGFFLRNRDLYPPVPTYTVSVDTSIADLINFAARNEVNYKILKEFNPWLRTDQLTVAKGKSYSIELPEKGYTSVQKLNRGINDGDAIFNDRRPSIPKEN